MKLVTKSDLYICQDTFEPVQDITIQVPYRLIHDIKMLDRDELIKAVGEQFLIVVGLIDPADAPTC